MLSLDDPAVFNDEQKRPGAGGKMSFAALFCSGAVLQRRQPIPVWGYAAPFCRLRCSLNDACAVTIANSIGKFKLYLPPQEAGTGLTLTLENLHTGEKIVSENIAVGEVYIAAGQSNMEFPLRRALGFEQEQNTPDDAQMRFFRVQATKYPAIQDDVNGSWQSASKEVSANFSATAYFFAKKLRRELGVPVGIIGIYLGGMGAETFISREALLKNGYFAADTAAYDLLAFQEEHYAGIPLDQQLPDGNTKMFAKLAEIFPDEPEKLGEKQSWHTAGFDDSDWESMELPDNWTLAGYNHAGVFWFRKNIVLPDSWRGKELTIGIGAADKADETFVNGVKIGSTGHFRDFSQWNVPRTYTIPGETVKSGSCQLAIRVSSAASICCDGGLTGPAEAMFIACGNERIPLAGEWKLKMEHSLGTAGMEFMRTLGPGVPSSLHMLFDNMVAPVIPYGVRGAIWYQGEANAICQAHIYKDLLLTLIDDWRTRWGQKNFDFIIIQLPGVQAVRDYSEFSQWAILREAQKQAAIASGSKLAVIFPYGDVSDLHPRNKKPVGELCARLVLENVHSPLPLNCKRENSEVVITFDSEIQNVTPETLMLAGKNGVFHPATGRFTSGCTMRLASPDVAVPVKVRYAWSENPLHGNLRSPDGLLVSPFELDL